MCDRDPWVGSLWSHHQQLLIAPFVMLAIILQLSAKTLTMHQECEGPFLAQGIFHTLILAIGSLLTTTQMSSTQMPSPLVWSYHLLTDICTMHQMDKSSHQSAPCICLTQIVLIRWSSILVWYQMMVAMQLGQSLITTFRIFPGSQIVSIPLPTDA
jgi:hypothetical protein